MITLLLSSLAAHAGVVTGPGGGLDAVYAPRRVAVVVGVQDYADPALAGLRFPAKDAQDMGRVLEDPDYGGFDRVFVIEGQQSTTAEGIAHAIDVATADLQRDDTFLLYLSGHGTLTIDAAQGSRLWFLPSDGKLGDPEHTGISVADLEEQVNGLGARRRVLIMDTCHNGRTDSKSAVNAPTAKLIQGFRGEPPAPRSLLAVSESEARLFAAQYYQPAMEDGELENGVYTHFLLAALTDQAAAADLDRDGLVDVAEAHDYARDRTIRYTGGLQVPRAEYRIVGREEIYLSGDPNRRTHAEKALLSAYDQVLAKAHLLVDGIPRGVLPGLTAVDPGRRQIELQSADGQTLARQTMRVHAGTMVPLEGMMRKQAEAGSRWMVGLGPSIGSGPGLSYFHRASPELELAWLSPMAGPPALYTDLHLRGSGLVGTVEEQGNIPVFAGFGGVGGTIGLQTHDFAIGPTLEATVPWRSFGNITGQHQQASLTGTGGLRAIWTPHLGQVELAIRYDARWTPFMLNAAWTSMWQHGIAIGVTTSR